MEAYLLERRHPAELLRDLHIVDTPWINAVIREHEALTRDFASPFGNEWSPRGQESQGAKGAIPRRVSRLCTGGDLGARPSARPRRGSCAQRVPLPPTWSTIAADAGRPRAASPDMVDHRGRCGTPACRFARHGQPSGAMRDARVPLPPTWSTIEGDAGRPRAAARPPARPGPSMFHAWNIRSTRCSTAREPAASARTGAIEQRAAEDLPPAGPPARARRRSRGGNFLPCESGEGEVAPNSHASSEVPCPSCCCCS